MSDLARLLDLVPFITAHQGIRIRDLATEFGTTEKEIKKDLELLWMCGLPGYTPLELMELSFDSGTVSIRNAETLRKPRRLTPTEALFLLIGLTQVSVAYPAYASEAQALAEKIRHVLKSAAEISPPSHLREIQLLREAMTKAVQVTFNYQSTYRDEISHRRVSPLEITTRGAGEFYLIGYCHVAQAQRTFSVKRMESLALSDEKLEYRTSNTSSCDVRVKVFRRARKYREYLSLHGDTFTTFSEEWALRACFAAAGDIEVVTPASLRSTLSRKAKAALALYS